MGFLIGFGVGYLAILLAAILWPRRRMDAPPEPNEADMPLHVASKELADLRGNGKVHADIIKLERPERR